LSHNFFFLSQRNRANKPIAVAAATPPTISIVLLVPGEVGLGVVTVMLGVGVGGARIGLGDMVCVGVEVGVGVALRKTNVSGIAIVKLLAPLGSSKVRLRSSTPL
jgi:hypothetical protein